MARADGATTKAKPAVGKQSVVDIIAQVAQEKGIPVGLALAIAKWESGLDPNNIGDNGHSVGLFQLNDQGEGSGLSVQQRQDPRRNAEIALSEVARVYQREPNASWGQIATDAQRPAARTFPAYHASINAAQAQYASAQPDQVVSAYKSGAPNAATAAQYDSSSTSQLASSTGSDGLPQTLTGKGGQDVASYLDGQYGYLTAFLNNPDIGPIIKQAAKEGWNDNTMLQALSKTSWWQTTGQTARQWESTLSTDPATAKAQLATTQSHITALAKTSGIHLSSDDVYHMAYAANMFGWSDLQIQQAVGAQFKYKSGATYGGAAGTDVQAMKELAHNYMVPVSDKAIQQWVGDSLSGNRSMGDFEAYVKNMAKSLYAGNSVITAGIDAGQTTQTIMDPWRQVAAQTLDKAPAEIDFTDPKFMKAVNQVDPKTGTMAPMSLEQWQTTLKTDKIYGYDHTDAAMNAASDLLTSFGQKMGTL